MSMSIFNHHFWVQKIWAIYKWMNCALLLKGLKFSTTWDGLGWLEHVKTPVNYIDRIWLYTFIFLYQLNLSGCGFCSSTVFSIQDHEYVANTALVYSCWLTPMAMHRLEPPTSSALKETKPQWSEPTRDLILIKITKRWYGCFQK